MAHRATKILTRREIATMLADLERKFRRSANARMNRVIFRLASCLGLRVSEISGLRLGDLRVGIARPHVVIRPTIAKGGRGRKVPLWWNQGTLDDVAAWVATRRAHGGRDADPFVWCLQTRKFGQPLGRHALRKRFRTACRSLGLNRLKQLIVHHGRHTFISHALAGGRTLAEVRDAAGHSNVSITSCYSCYLHLAVEDDGSPGRLFEV
jgi:integrase